MKIRSNFVTNSSSSSYIIGFKDIKKLDCWDTLPEFAKKIINKYIDMAVKHSDVINTIEELNREYLCNYGYKNIEEFLADEDEFYTNAYKDSVKAIENGYSISWVDIDYNDETGNDFYSELQREDDGTGIYLIRGDY